MEKIELSEVKDLVQYEKAREAMRASVIALKRRRRVQVGPNVSVLFENRETVLFQIQEMVRAERIVEEARLREEVEVYNQLVPGPGELSATLFIELPDLHLMSQEQVRRTVNRFQGLERDCVSLRIGDAVRVAARFEDGHSNEEKMAAVHYLRFALSPQAQGALADTGRAACLVVEHPHYDAEAALAADVRAELLADLLA
jgi:hypothetical protein